MNEEINTAIYIRVSTEEQANEGFSINAQKDKLTKYAEINDWKIYDYYIDDGISGKNLDERPEVCRLLNDIKNKKVNNLLIYKLDRLTRSLRDLIYLIEFFEEYSCTFNSQTEKIDTSNAVGRMFIKIIGIFAEFERENLAERISFGYEQKTREGNYTNTNGVYGYDYVVGEKKLVVNEEEKLLVNNIFDLYLEGFSCLKISHKMNKLKVPTKRGGKWSPNTIKSIISNPLYIGKVRYGVSEKYKDKSFIVDSKDVEPIIDTYKWNLVNTILKDRKKNMVRRYPSEKSYFLNYLKCSCGSRIVARQQTHNGKVYITYKCSNSKDNCKCMGFSHNKIEILFKEALNLVKIDKNNVCDLINQFEDIKVSDDIINLKLNWEFLDNNEKRQFLERFIDCINVDNKNGLIIESILFKVL